MTPEAAVGYVVERSTAILTIDFPPVNALGAPVRDGLMARLKQAAADDAVTAIVIIGGNGRFVAGADIRELQNELRGATLKDLTAFMEASPKPVVAAIDGYALGGGLELALGAHARIAAYGAKLGFPEINLGILPGGGGTQRGTRLIGPKHAADLMLSGRHIGADEALAMSLIDEVADGDLRSAAVELTQRKTSPAAAPSTADSRKNRFEERPKSFFDDLRKSNAIKWRGTIAPLKVSECIEAALRLPLEEGLLFERAAFKACKEAPAHAAQVHLFFAERAAAKVSGIDKSVKPRATDSVAIIGAGTMGCGIAMAVANTGIAATLLDVNPANLSNAIERIEKLYSASVSRGSMSAGEAQGARQKIRTAQEYSAIGSCDLAIEAAFEDLNVKREIFARLAEVMMPASVLATNTSALDIDAIAAATGRPDNVVGLHFFSPANVMKLLEIVRGARTSDVTIATAMAFARRIGKIPVIAKNADGFIGNRILRAYGREADFLVEEGANPSQVDGALKEFGFPMGLYLMRDMAGLDVGWRSRVARGIPTDAVDYHATLWDRLCELGRFGQKTGAGYYKYEGRAATPDPEVDEVLKAISLQKGIVRRSFSDSEIVLRIMCAMVNEGAHVLEEGVAQRASDIDVAYVHGYGFPKYRGGPMFWAEREGLGKILAEVQRQSARSPRWKPSALLVRLAQEGADWPG